MNLIYGPVCLLCAVLVWKVTLVAVRSPNQGRWNSDFMVQSIYIPSVIGLVVFGIAMLLRLAL